jgi:UDP-N-acetylmuramoyl-tripeptide--D-alanyl-D-alanine ligase
MSIEQLYPIFLKSSGISTDTRKIEAGNIFFALKGPSFNGNMFAEKALESGASHAVIDEKEFQTDERFILVDDVLNTLQQLAKHHRQQLTIPIIAITGSNGKTTTKELTHAVLSTKFNTFATHGNLNNHIGVPLSLLSISSVHEMAIIEMGANHQGEIASYCEWALPDFGMINNIGSAHLEGFGGIEGVIKGKTELYKSLAQNNGTVFYNADDALLEEKSKIIKTRISYGTNTNANYSFELIAESPFVKIKMQGTEIASNLTGTYNFPNLMAAAAIGAYFGLSVNEIKQGIESYVPANNRSQIVEKNGTKYIMDAYNANPTSMEAALRSFATLQATKKMIVIGDMFELGETSSSEHLRILQLAAEMTFDKVIAVGEKFGEHQHLFPFTFLKDASAVKEFLQRNQTEGYTILVKGSRGMKLETAFL